MADTTVAFTDVSKVDAGLTPSAGNTIFTANTQGIYKLQGDIDSTTPTTQVYVYCFGPTYVSTTVAGSVLTFKWPLFMRVGETVTVHMRSTPVIASAILSAVRA